LTNKYSLPEAVENDFFTGEVGIVWEALVGTIKNKLQNFKFHKFNSLPELGAVFKLTNFSVVGNKFTCATGRPIVISKFNLFRIFSRQKTFYL